MSLSPRHLLRMANWARNPPSAKRVKQVLAVVAVVVAIWGLERIFGTPDWMQLEQAPRGVKLR
ncbi:MAG: hypothetical protein P8X69_13750 [Maritimibacter sp.]